MPDVTPPGGGLDQSDILSDGTPFAGSDVGETLSELQSGRTRGLLLLLQDKPVPEVQDPMNAPTAGRVATVESDGDQTLDGTDMPVFEFSGSRGTPLTHTINASNYDQITVYGRNNTSAFTEDGTVTITDITNDVQIASDTSGGGVSVESTYDVSQFDGSLTIEWVQSGAGGNLTDAYIETSNAVGGYVTDAYTPTTTPPANFQQYHAIRAEGVDVGGSTSSPPVELEILNSTNATLTSSRIPPSEFVDEPFVMRNRVYSETAGSDGQSDYQIPISGEGGHFGIPILTVVSVKKNGAVLDSANWSFDGDTAVTIDTSNATIASGDTIDIKYDFDVFDSTLQPRAYLSREDTSETSPSISHFRYEYVI